MRDLIIYQQVHYIGALEREVRDLQQQLTEAQQQRAQRQEVLQQQETQAARQSLDTVGGSDSSDFPIIQETAIGSDD